MKKTPAKNPFYPHTGLPCHLTIDDTCRPTTMGRRESRDSDASMETIAWSGHSTAVGAIDWRRQSVPRGATGHDRGDHGRRKPGDHGDAPSGNREDPRIGQMVD